MAAPMKSLALRCCPQRISIWSAQAALFHTASPTCLPFVNKRAGVPKVTRDKSRPLTYEEMKYPEEIGRSKGWNSWHTGNLFEEEKRTPHANFEDIFIRKFMQGTWPELLATPVIIKRRANTIILSALVYRKMQQQKYYFLTGYTEELLSIFLKRQVRLELQTVEQEDMIMKYI